MEALLAPVGLVLIVQHGRIFDSTALPVRQVVRNLSSWLALLLGCSLCFGFWAPSIVWLVCAPAWPLEVVLTLGTSALVGMASAPLLAPERLFAGSIAGGMAFSLLAAPIVAFSWAIQQGVGAELFAQGLACAPLAWGADAAMRRFDP